MLTKEQQEVVDIDFKDILLVNAYAGTGKTHTLVQFCEKRKDKKILYLAYNSSMSKEAQEKFKHIKSVSVMTMHSLAYNKTPKDYISRCGKNALSARDLIYFCADLEEKYQAFYSNILLILIRKFCNTSLMIEDFISDLIKNQRAGDYELPKKIDLAYICEKLPKLWWEIHNNPKLAYEHDFYLKNFQMGYPKLDYDYILVDEAQDINGCVIDIVLNQTQAKKVFIGDTFQSIYKFRGASNSLEILSKEPNTITLFLTQSFRCPLSVANLANQYLELAGATKKFIGTQTQKRIETNQKAYLTRTNAKLFDIAMGFEKEKIYYVGGFDSYNFQDIIDAQNLIFKKTDYIQNKTLKEFHNVKEFLQYMDDSQDIELRTPLMMAFKYLNENILKLAQKLKQAETKKIEKADIILSTAHKSKGLEFLNVEIANDFLDCKEFYDKAKEKQDYSAIIPKEELNLFYVALTRSKQDLNLSENYILTQDDIDNIKRDIIIE